MRLVEDVIELTSLAAFFAMVAIGAGIGGILPPV